MAAAALSVVLFGAPIACGQTNVTVLTGSGQISCIINCPVIVGSYQPLIVKVTDAAGRPVANATVNWAVTGGLGLVSLGSDTSVTDSSGIASMTVCAIPPGK